MSLHRTCCCVDDIGPTVVCSNTASFYNCSDTPAPGGPPGSTVAEAEAEPSDHHVFRVTGSRLSRAVFASSSSTEDTVLTSADETYDYVFGLYPQYGRPPTESEVLADYGNNGVMRSFAPVNISAGGPLFAAAFEINASEDNLIPGRDVAPAMFSWLPFISQGTRLVMTYQVGVGFGFCRNYQEQTGEVIPGSFWQTVDETWNDSILSDPLALAGRKRNVRRSVNGFPSGNTSTSTTTTTDDVDLAFAPLLSFGSLPPSWSGPAGYNICSNLASIQSPQNPNQLAIDAANINNPLYTCKGCGQ